MKLTKILPLIPIIGLLTSCAQTEVKVTQDTGMVAEKQTEAPTDFVVYPDDRPSVPDGKILWASQNCASCHGATGETAQNGKALADKLAMGTVKPVEQYRTLTYKEPHKLLTKLSNKEIWSLVWYARSLSNPPLGKEDMDIIAPVFGSNCAVCHGTKGDGDGPLARNLEPNPANFQTLRRFYDRTDDTLYDHIANGIRWEGMPNFLGKEDKKKNFKFDHDNIRKLVLYVRNFHMSNEGTVATTGSAPAAPAAATPKEAPKETAPAASTPPATTSTSTDTAATPKADAASTQTSTGTATAPESKAAPAAAADKKSDAASPDSKAAGQATEKKTSTSDDKSH